MPRRSPRLVREDAVSHKDDLSKTDTMKDIDIRHIAPVVEHRALEKPVSAEKPSGAAFLKELNTAVMRADAPGSLEDRVRQVEHDLNKTSQQINELRNSTQSLVMKIAQLRSDKAKS